jgi:protein phosphatase
MVAAVTRFQALPEGALVGNETYYVTRLCHEAPDHHVYRIEERIPVLACPSPQCGYLDNLAGTSTCLLCGASLAGVVPVHRRHQLYEYRELAPVAMVAHMVDRGVRHPGLMLPGYFAEAPYGREDRYYLVVPEPAPALASQSPVPQKVVRVLDWGAQLADGLAYLHRNHIGWHQVNADHVAVQDRKAMWTAFDAARGLSADPAEAAVQRSQDVTGLTRLLFFLATGLDAYAPDVDLPPLAHGVFRQILGEPAESISAENLAGELGRAVSAIRRPETLCLRVGHCTDVGMVRDLNEDSLLTLELDQIRRSVSRPVGLFAVADGMGGHAAGDAASGLAIETLARHVATHMLVPHLTGDGSGEPLEAQLWLVDAVQAANQAVYARRQSAQTNMGTTLVAAVVVGDTAYLANVGDSRAYLVNRTGIRQITTDHSLVERLVALGQISSADARSHPQRNVIYRTIGDQERAEVDCFVQRLTPGDSLLLCSDGLSGKLEDSDIWQLLQRHRSPQDACEELVQAANARGGEDNITVIVVQAQ